VSITKVRILAFLQPFISVGSGALAAWLFVHVHVLGVFNVSQSDVAADIAYGTVFLVTAGLTWLGQHEHLVPITSAMRRGLTIPKGFTEAEVVAFMAPYISTVAGMLTAWLFVHVHFLATFHVGATGVTSAVAGAVVFATTAILTELSAQFHILPSLYPRSTLGGLAP
jgi:hypothetical protein